MTDVFLVGSKGIPAQYGGFETFVENLTAGKTDPSIRYHVSCMNQEEKHFEYHEADCFNVKVPLPGAPGRTLHVSRVLRQVEQWIKENHPENVIVYVLGCRVGPLLYLHANRLRKYNARIFVNPDGLEWKRAKWNGLAKRILLYCEACIVKNADLVVCDSQNIEKYVQITYPSKVRATTFIAYGADVIRSNCSMEKLQSWYEKFGVQSGNYYLIVGRFVPENNYETMLTEFMQSNTKKNLVIITNVEQNKFYKVLSEKTGFEKDSRIKFVGTVYDQELLKKIREEAYGYIHGHEVGGTNPSLLEALASTKVNLLLNVGFNQEVAEESALYWSKQPGSLANLLEATDCLTLEERTRFGEKANYRIKDVYNWESICRQYEGLFK